MVPIIAVNVNSLFKDLRIAREIRDAAMEFDEREMVVVGHAAILKFHGH